MKSHQMSVNGKYDEINRKDILTLAKNINIKKADEKIDSVIDVVSNWNNYAKKAKVNSEQIRFIHSVLQVKL